MTETAFAAKALKAADLHRQIHELSQLSAQKLSVTAYPREAIAAADSSLERLAALARKIEAGGEGLEATRSALRRMVSMVRSPNYPVPPRSVRPLGPAITDGSLAELAALGSGPFELFALAVQTAAEKHPEDFGKADTFGAVERKLRDLIAQRDELFAQIATAWKSEDLEIGPGDPKGNHKIWIKMSKRNVTLAPAENLGERLTNWLLANCP